jgi:hypothetical protein
MELSTAALVVIACNTVVVVLASIGIVYALLKKRQNKHDTYYPRSQK